VIFTQPDSIRQGSIQQDSIQQDSINCIRLLVMNSAEYPAAEPQSIAPQTEPQTEPLSIQAASKQSLMDEECTTFVETTDESELAADSNPVIVLERRVADLHRQEQALHREIADLQGSKTQLQSQLAETQTAIAQLVNDGVKELEQRKRELQISVEKLERRQERVREEMRSTFAGVSQDLAIRVQSFKEYLVGSLQDLALAADQLELTPSAKEPTVADPLQDDFPLRRSQEDGAVSSSTMPKFAASSFQEQTKKIRSLLDQYRNRPDYYGIPWQLRRTFEPIHAERVSNWFFTQGGRGAICTLGSRLQNILVASASISVLRELYGDRLCALVLADSPERLGEWRRGLQDCLGITRSDFGPDRGAALFEDPFVLSQKADRLTKDGLMPFIVIDETEEQIDLAILQFPLWLAFAPNPQAPNYNRDWL
jgi:Protein of unknown function (DUF3086)